MSQAERSGVDSTPLDQIDLSDPTVFGDDSWRPWFVHLRQSRRCTVVQSPPLAPIGPSRLKTTQEEDDFVYGSIEVFRAVGGKICEFANPIHIQDTNGVWG